MSPEVAHALERELFVLKVQIHGLQLAADQVTSPQVAKMLIEIIDTERRCQKAMQDALDEYKAAAIMSEVAE